MGFGSDDGRLTVTDDGETLLGRAPGYPGYSLPRATPNVWFYANENFF